MSEKNELQPWRIERYCIPEADRARFVAQMETILDVYQGSYDETHVLITMDEASRHGVRKNGALWLRRWVVGRIEREDVRERMRSHRLVHPIRHGARVPRPRRDTYQRRLDTYQRRLFEES